MEKDMAWIFLLVVAGVTGGFYLLFPRITRRGLLFGVYIGEEAFGGEEARRITRSWYWGMSLWFAACVGLGLYTGIQRQSIVGSLVSLTLLPIGFLEEYLRAYAKARHLAQQGGAPQAAAFIANVEFRPLFLPYLAIGFGLAGGLYALGFAWSHYAELPNLIPVHFGLFGRPDLWRPRSVFRAMMPSFLCLILGVGTAAMAHLIGQAKRAIRSDDHGVSFQAQLRFRRIMANYLAVVSLLITAMLTTLSQSSIRVALGWDQALSPAMMIMTIVMIAVALVGSIYIALKYGQGGSRLERGAANRPLTDGLADNRLWVLGMFYVNREDPSIFVERRFGLGYTLNFGNPKAIALLCGFFGLIILVIAISRLAA